MLQPVGALGRRVRQTTAGVVTTLEFVGAGLRATALMPRGARGYSFGASVRQIYFTAVQAIPIVTSLAFIMGLVVVGQARAQSARLGVGSGIGDLLATVLVRDLGPLFTAIVVVGRSGTAIGAEVASYQALGELRALEALGVDPVQLLLPPRVIACSVSLAILTMFFDASALIGGMVGSRWFIAMSTDAYLRSIQLSLTAHDVFTVIARAALLGAGIGGTACYAGLKAGYAPSEIPRSATRGVVRALMFVFVATAVLTIIPLVWSR